MFPNYAPTYTFNAARHPGSKSENKPLYYLPGGRDGKNRDVVCDVAGWASDNYAPDAMNTSTDAPRFAEVCGRSANTVAWRCTMTITQ
ncbi:hypothetical protein ACIRJS_02275 [Streptomyces sp. NPDC102340]|uniref:hypothetical protein n=1 Tax=unclassified Streptomyces TaxID=2593676 RepID=UPI0037FC9041